LKRSVNEMLWAKKETCADGFYPRRTTMAARKRTGKKKAAKRKAAPKKASKRELIDTGTNKLFVRRNARGTSFKKVVDATSAKRKVPSGQGDRGDRT
jgi:hypothetical protein